MYPVETGIAIPVEIFKVCGFGEEAVFSASLHVREHDIKSHVYLSYNKVHKVEGKRLCKKQAGEYPFSNGADIFLLDYHTGPARTIERHFYFGRLHFQPLKCRLIARGVAGCGLITSFRR